MLREKNTLTFAGQREALHKFNSYITMSNYRILVVDDEEDLCEILKFNLENEGYEIDTCCWMS